ncbi:MAG: hypothetical protein IKQ17_00110 [Kiritimatiellae bacterium]|nr:hypothetical protein [Kiritimatiellia bacterium]
MNKLLALGAAAFIGGLFAETEEEAYARLSAYRNVWETNAWAYAKSINLAKGQESSGANGRWFVDFLSYPDVTDTNRFYEVFSARETVLFRTTGAYGIRDNTNCWYALADYIARIKDVADPRWIDEQYEFVTDVLDDGVTLGGNTNPLLNFASYKLEHYEEYKRQHTNLVVEADAFNAFCEEWRFMIRDKQNRERALKRAQDYAKYQTMRDRFWLFGAKDLSADVKALCRSNIVERAHLTPEEEHDIFEDVPDWYYRVMGIRGK